MKKIVKSSHFRQTKNFGNKEIVIRNLTQDDLNYPEKFRYYINSLIRDKTAYISFNKEKSLRDELKWVGNTIREIKKQKTVVMIAEHNNRIVGETAISLFAERRLHVAELGISVLKDYRKIGLGSYLLACVIKLAREKLKPTPRIIRLSVFSLNKKAIVFYQKHGFKIVAVIPRQFKFKRKFIDEIVMLLNFRERRRQNG